MLEPTLSPTGSVTASPDAPTGAPPGAPLGAPPVSNPVTGIKPTPAKRPLIRRFIQLLRRGHLYFGLFLFPWAVLYGVTAFLFNHPNAFSDGGNLTSFGAELLHETPLATPPSAQSTAEQVVQQLNEVKQPATPFALAGEGKFTGRDFAFATVKTSDRTINLLFDLKNGGGSVRWQSTPATAEKPAPPKPAPFAIGTPNGPGGGNGRGGAGGRGGAPNGGPNGGRGGERGARPSEGRSAPNSLQLADSIRDRIQATIPILMERLALPTGEVTITSIPDVTFPIDADGSTWTATYNPLTGTVSGSSSENRPTTELSWRRFLLRLHTAHVYPSEINSRWLWAVIVDVMAFTMCFWGVTGLIMWWQIKSTRTLGLALLILSAIAATALGIGMHTAMTGG